MLVHGLELEKFDERFFEGVKEGAGFSMPKTPYSLGKIAMWTAVYKK